MEQLQAKALVGSPSTSKATFPQWQLPLEVIFCVIGVIPFMALAAFLG
jgi:hypothetical protein